MRTGAETYINIKELKKIVNYHFECDIETTCRERRYVNGRMTFAYILKEKGYTLTSIGHILKRNHATIIHYLKNMEFYLKQDRDFKNRFDFVMEDYYENSEPIHDMQEDELKKEIFSLKLKIKDLSSLNDRLTFEQKNTVTVDKRLTDIADMFSQRIRIGTEDEVKIKLNHFLNGLYYS